MVGTCASWCWFMAHARSELVHWVAASSTALSREGLMLLNQLPSSHSIYLVGHRPLGAQLFGLVEFYAKDGFEMDRFY